MESGLFFSLAPPQLGQKEWKTFPFLPFLGVDSTLSRFCDFFHCTCAPAAGIVSLNPIGCLKIAEPSPIG